MCDHHNKSEVTEVFMILKSYCASKLKMKFSEKRTFRHKKFSSKQLSRKKSTNTSASPITCTSLFAFKKNWVGPMDKENEKHRFWGSNLYITLHRFFVTSSIIWCKIEMFFYRHDKRKKVMPLIYTIGFNRFNMFCWWICVSVFI